ncbi:MAG: hypothetical protein AABX73_04005 [Nanoarchaeota archaeon]
MDIEEKEVEHIVHVLKEIKQYLAENNAIKLKELSNHTIHSASTYQDAGSITLAVLVYTLSKLIEREDYKKIKDWREFIKKLNAIIDKSIAEIEKNNQKEYEEVFVNSRKLLESVSPNLKKYIEEVIRKASINKGSKIYEHGISLEQTSRLLGITQWELSEYIGQKNLPETKPSMTINIKKRAEMALEFFK